MPFRLFVVVCACLFTVGCGTSLPSSVSGRVTLDDVPLTTGDVTFAPVGEGQIAYGRIDGSGNYSLTTANTAGVEAGEYYVTVVATGTPPSNDQPPPLLTPARYSDKTTSLLKHTVVPGNNILDLKLTSQ